MKINNYIIKMMKNKGKVTVNLYMSKIMNYIMI